MQARFSTLVFPDLPVRAFRLRDAALATCEMLVHAGGKVIAMSEGLRRQGLQHGWSTERARAHALPCEPALRAFQAPLTHLAREAMLGDLNRLTPWLEILPPLPDRHPLADLRAMAHLPDEQQARHLAVRLQGQAGTASDRSTALLAALQAPPGEVRIVPEGGEAAFRESLPLAVLRETGVAEDTLERLHWLGFDRVGRLARLTPRQVQSQFADGALLCRLLDTSDRRPVALFHPPPSVTRRHVLPDPAYEPAEYEPVLWHLVRSAVAGLEGREASMVSVTLELASEGAPRMVSGILEPAPEGAPRMVSARRLPHAPTADPREIRTLARLALEEARRAGPHLPITSMLLALEGLVRPQAEQACLWPERTRTLRQALERMEMQSPGAILRFVPQDAASILPEETYRLVNALQGPRPSPPPRARRAPRRPGRHATRHDGSTATGWEEFHETLPGAD